MKISFIIAVWTAAFAVGNLFVMNYKYRHFAVLAAVTVITTLFAYAHFIGL